MSFCCCDLQNKIIDQCDGTHDYGDCPDQVIIKTYDGFGLPIESDAGGGFIEINFCPWCGSNLTSVTL